MLQTELSIIIPVYNVKPYIHRCIDSVLAQSFSGFEVILVDDGSTDGCGEICDEYSQKDARIMVIHTENHGLQSAVFTGISAAKGEYIGFVDSDDYIDPGMFECLYNEIKSASADMVQCGAMLDYPKRHINISSQKYTVIENGQSFAFDFFENLTISPLSNSRWNKIYRTILLKKCIVNLHSGATIGEDLILNLKYLSLCKKVVILKDLPYYHYQASNTSMNRAYDDARMQKVIHMGNEISKIGTEIGADVDSIKYFTACELIASILLDANKPLKKAKLIKLVLKDIDNKSKLIKASTGYSAQGRIAIKLVSNNAIYLSCLIGYVLNKITQILYY